MRSLEGQQGSEPQDVGRDARLQALQEAVVGGEGSTTHDTAAVLTALLDALDAVRRRPAR